MYEMIGIISALCMTASSLPQAWLTYKKGSAEELSMSAQVLWLLGEICYLMYIFPIHNWILIVNSMPPLICVLTIIYYKLFPRRKNVQQVKTSSIADLPSKHDSTG